MLPQYDLQYPYPEQILLKRAAQCSLRVALIATTIHVT
jgi:hypothetical protein